MSRIAKHVFDSMERMYVLPNCYNNHVIALLEDGTGAILFNAKHMCFEVHYKTKPKEVWMTLANEPSDTLRAICSRVANKEIILLTRTEAIVQSIIGKYTERVVYLASYFCEADVSISRAISFKDIWTRNLNHLDNCCMQVMIGDSGRYVNNLVYMVDTRKIKYDSLLEMIRCTDPNLHPLYELTRTHDVKGTIESMNIISRIFGRSFGIFELSKKFLRVKQNGSHPWVHLDNPSSDNYDKLCRDRSRIAARYNNYRFVINEVTESIFKDEE